MSIYPHAPFPSYVYLWLVPYKKKIIQYYDVVEQNLLIKEKSSNGRSVVNSYRIPLMFPKIKNRKLLA